MLLLQLLQDHISLVLTAVVRFLQHSVVSSEKSAAIDICGCDRLVFIRSLLFLVAIITFIKLIILFAILKVCSVVHLFLLFLSAYVGGLSHPVSLVIDKVFLCELGQCFIVWLVTLFRLAILLRQLVLVICL